MGFIIASDCNPVAAKKKTSILACAALCVFEKEPNVTVLRAT